MQGGIPIELFLSVIGFCGVLAGIIYKNLNDKILELQKQVCAVPTAKLVADVAEIKTNIEWLKQYIVKD